MNCVDCPNKSKCSQRVVFWVDSKGAMGSVESKEIIGCIMEGE